MDLTVGDEKPPPYVQYHSGDASVAFVTADQQPSQEPPNKARGCRCTALKSLGVAVTLCLITTVAALTLFFLQRADILPKVEHSKKADLPDVTNLYLVAADNHYLTVAWDRPRLSFDFYWLNVTGGFENASDSLSMRTARACGNGTIIHPQQTQITCGPFDSCSSVDVTIRTYNKGPHELMSKGTTLSDIFIGGEELSDVFNLVLVRVDMGYVTISWQRPRSRFDYYSVEVYEDGDSAASSAQQGHRLCANGTIIRPDQTEVTCGPFEPCTNLSFTVRTYLKGPPERRSPGATLTGIFIPAEGMACLL
ncbi:hypothetical protein HPB51_000179 [Rhipicephalus microplus]|uniref:Uncharacterized protein n=1 Tax=Rhipicephalus microplus TaxID=6941 RepID=A0A9J6E4Z9_RHIMP|nr:hypothetical protein HPB51_000179 [Rhipicephalus microplus]